MSFVGKRLLLFCYDFPHVRSLTGLEFALRNEFVETLVWAAPFVSINGSKEPKADSSDPTAPKLAQANNCPVVKASHSDESALWKVRSWKPDIALILGARRLPKELLEGLPIPIVNFHPGVLPENRGLDAVPWSVRLRLPIGVSTHFIDHRLDAGAIISNSIIRDIPRDASLADLYAAVSRLQYYNIERFTSKLHLLKDMPSSEPISGDIGEYHSRMQQEDIPMPDVVREYLRQYKVIAQEWERQSTYPNQNLKWGDRCIDFDETSY